MEKQTGYKGTVVFTKCVDYGWISTFTDISREGLPDGYLYLGEAEVDVTFETDTTAAEIEALEKQVQKERAESKRRIDMIQGRIKDLQALPYREVS